MTDIASITYGGQTFTSNGSPKLKAIDGLDGWAGASPVYALVGNHGAIPGPGYAEHKEFQLLFQLIGSDQASLNTQRALLRSVFNPRGEVALGLEEETLTIAWPGWPPVQIDCRVSSRESDLGAHSPLMSIRMVASDPTLYSQTLTSTVLSVFVGAGGLSYNVTYNKDYGASGSGTSTFIPNTGDWETWPRFEIAGPTTGTLLPTSIENTTTGKSIIFSSLSIPSGSTLVIETHPARRTVRFTDGVSRWNTVAGAEWWPINAGGANLVFRATGDTAGSSCTVKTRSAYL